MWLLHPVAKNGDYASVKTVKAPANTLLRPPRTTDPTPHTPSERPGSSRWPAVTQCLSTPVMRASDKNPPSPTITGSSPLEYIGGQFP